MGKTDRVRAEVSALDEQLAAGRRRMAGLVALADRTRTEVQEAGRRALGRVDQELQRAALEQSPPHALPWDHQAWTGWTPGGQGGDRRRLRLGTHLDGRRGDDLRVADTVGFVGSGRSLLITSRGPEQAAVAQGLLQSLVVRLALMFPDQASFVLLEAAHSGGPLVRMARSLHRAETASSRDRARAALEAVTGRIERVGADHLSSTRPTFEHLPEREQLDLGLQFVVASEFPTRLGDREIEMLDVAASDGPEKGTYCIVHWDLDEEMPITVRRAPFAAATRVDVGQRHGTLAGAVPTTTRFDGPPADAEARLGGIERAEPSSRAVTWDEVAVPAEQVWQGDARRGVTTPLARGGAGDDWISVTFGTDAQGEPVSHGVVAGRTGSGKSRLLHALLCGLAVRYDPLDLALYLIDGKSGLEFEPYRALPHARVVSLHTAPALARSVLHELETEMGRRAGIFTDAGVNDLVSYRQREDAVRLPRVLCVIDEFQEVFDEGGEDEGMRLLNVLTTQGRAYGIHVLLASQSFQPSGLRGAGKFYGNVALRMALALDRSELEAVDLFGGAAGRQTVLDTCTTAGRVVVNDRGGRVEGNHPGRFALVDDTQLPAVVADMAARARDEGRPRVPVVFHGAQAPRVSEHPLVVDSRALDGWRDDDALTEVARRPCSQRGLGHERWQAGERPVLAAFGRAQDVHGQTSAALRRAQGENVVLVGANEPERIGMLLGALAVMATAHPPDRLRIAVLDRSLPGSETAHLLTDAVASLTAGRHQARLVGPSGGATPVAVEEGPAAEEALVRELADEVERRAALPEAEVAAEPSIVLVGHDLDRCDALRQIDDAYGSTESELGARLSLVLTKGPSVGVHSLLSFGFVSAAKAIVGDTGINRSFRHRVALAMSDDESFDLLRSSAASRLSTVRGEGGRREAVTALYLDRQTNAEVAFKPYTAFSRGPGDEGIADDVAQVAALVSRWAVA